MRPFIPLRAASALSVIATPAVAQASQVHGADASAQHLRVLPLQGGQNFRDLGGYTTSDGHVVKWGVLYRSGSMHFLTPTDYAYLEKLGIRTVCDFRDTHERVVEPTNWPPGAPPRVLADDYTMDISGIGLNSPARTPTAEEARASVAAVYPRILTQFNSQYRRMFKELLAGNTPLVFNCTAGKDRTGVAAALLLTALGVPRETVVQDYLLTNRYFDPAKVVHSDDQASRQWRKLPPDVLRAYMGADRSYIEAIFKVIDVHAGGADGYFREELGLTANDLAKLRSMYTC